MQQHNDVSEEPLAKCAEGKGLESAIDGSHTPQCNAIEMFADVGNQLRWEIENWEGHRCHILQPTTCQMNLIMYGLSGVTPDGTF
jgi:hypothetical protein